MGIQKQRDDEYEQRRQPRPSNIPPPPAGNFLDPSGVQAARPVLIFGQGPARLQEQGQPAPRAQQQTLTGPNPWQGARPPATSARPLIPPSSLRQPGPAPPSGGSPLNPSGRGFSPLPHIPELRPRPQAPRGPPPPQSGPPIDWIAGVGGAVGPGYDTPVEDLPGGVDSNVAAQFSGLRGHPRGGPDFAGGRGRGAGAGAGAGGAGRGGRDGHAGRDTGADSGRGGRVGRGG